jgi:catechol 2,3-dioxygenase-like lactoylglutathione lyase family enzyme
MQPYDLAIPTLPCRSISATVAFYRSLGFEGGAHQFNSQYAVLRRGAVELHFFIQKELLPAESSAGCYIRVLDVESMYRTFLSSQLPRTGIPRMDALEEKPWGLREFAVVDPDGNLLRIGQVIKT